MSRRLAQALLDKNMVTSEAIEDAFQRQVIQGGSLGTNLLEARAISEQVLLEALAEFKGCDYADKSAIDQINPELAQRFPQVFSETYHLVPYRLSDSALEILVSSDGDEQLLARATERLGIALKPRVTSEMRLHYAMARLYGVSLLPRFSELLQREDGNFVQNGSTASSGEMLSWGVVAPPRPETRRKSRSVNLRELISQLDTTQNRDAIVGIVQTAVVGIFDFSALFLVHPDRVSGWRGQDSASTQRILHISVPLELPSVFQTVYATEGHYLGPLPENTANGRLLDDIGRSRPRAAFLAPIKVGGKLAIILYADNGDNAISPRRVAGLLILLHRAGVAFERLIRQQREGQKEAASEEESRESLEQVVSPVHRALPDEEPPAQQFPEVPEMDSTALEEGGAVSPPQSHGEDGWDDVSVNSLGIGLGVPESSPALGAEQPAEDLLVTWSDVIDEAHNAARFLEVKSEESVEVAGAMVSEIELLFDGLLASEHELRADAITRLLAYGHSIDEAIGERFPGQINSDLLDVNQPLPSFEECSGITALLLARGESVAGLVLPFLESSTPQSRLIALYFFKVVHYPPSVDALARRFFDKEPAVRKMAIAAIAKYAGSEPYNRILNGIRAQLRLPVLESRVAATHLLGELRDVDCVPLLIRMLVAPESQSVEMSYWALGIITGQHFGVDIPAWSQWWRDNYQRPRHFWLIEGLRSDDFLVRQRAHAELESLVGHSAPFEPAGNEAEKEKNIELWEEKFGVRQDVMSP